MADQATKDILEGAQATKVPGSYDPTMYDPPKIRRRTANHMVSLDEAPKVKAKYSTQDDMDVLEYQVAPGFGYVAHKAEKRNRHPFQVPRDRLRMLLVPFLVVLALGVPRVAGAVSTLSGVAIRVTTVCSTTASAQNVCNNTAMATPWP